MTSRAEYVGIAANHRAFLWQVARHSGEPTARILARRCLYEDAKVIREIDGAEAAIGDLLATADAICIDTEPTIWPGGLTAPPAALPPPTAASVTAAVEAFAPAPAIARTAPHGLLRGLVWCVACYGLLRLLADLASR